MARKKTKRMSKTARQKRMYKYGERRLKRGSKVGAAGWASAAGGVATAVLSKSKRLRTAGKVAAGLGLGAGLVGGGMIKSGARISDAASGRKKYRGLYGERDARTISRWRKKRGLKKLGTGRRGRK